MSDTSVGLDPNLNLANMLDTIEIKTNNQYDITDPTSPFLMLMEGNVFTANDLNIEMTNKLRKLYPSLSSNINDLHHHLVDDDLINAFAIPSSAVFKIIVSKVDLISNGYRPDGKDYVICTIPEFTKIDAGGTMFTLLNKINVYFYDNGTVFTDQELSSTSIGIEDIGILDNAMVTDNDGVEWIILETKIKQVKVTETLKSMNSGQMFNEDIAFTNQFHFAEVYVKKLGSTTWEKVHTTYSHLVFDIYKPTAILTKGDGILNIKIPELFILNNSISGDIKILIFTTEGKLTKSIDKFGVGDYTVTLYDKVTTNSESVTKEIALLSKSSTILDLGSDEKSFTELRTSVINNTSKKIVNPITENELKEFSVKYNFEITKILDVITDRIFTASRTLSFKNDPYKIKADMFMIPVNNSITELTDSPFAIVNKDTLIIKSNSIFKYDNGIIKLLSTSEYNALEASSQLSAVEYINNNKLFTNLHHYVIDKADKTVNARVYKLEYPILENLKIIDKNTNVDIKVNINNFGIVKDNYGYILLFSLIGNENFDILPPATVKGQIKINIFDSLESVYIDNYDYNNTTKIMSFRLETEFIIDSNDTIVLNNQSVLEYLTIELISNLDIIIYTDDPSVKLGVDSNFLNDLNITDKSNITALTKESILMNLGERIEFMWNKVNTIHTPRIYSTYANDEIALYKEDVYDFNPDTNSIFTPVLDELGNVISLDYTKLHSVGDPILDNKGNNVYLHRAGDIILDDNGNPVLDLDQGLVRIIDIMAIEYQFNKASETSFVNYRSDVAKLINQWCIDDIGEINKVSLENTEILFKPYKNTNQVTVLANNLEYKVDWLITPKIKVYVNDITGIDNAKLTEMKRVAGNVIHEEISKEEFSLKTIGDLIKASMDSYVLEVSTTNMININGGIDIIKVKSGSNRFSIKKLLSIDTEDKSIVEYDIDLEIIKI